MGKIKSMIKWVMLGFIRLYGYFLSPLMGYHCRFYPSCSNYARQAIQQHGCWRGLLYTIGRIIRCHPWHEGGLDPVPETAQQLRLKK